MLRTYVPVVGFSVGILLEEGDLSGTEELAAFEELEDFEELGVFDELAGTEELSGMEELFTEELLLVSFSENSEELDCSGSLC